MDSIYGQQLLGGVSGIVTIKLRPRNKKQNDENMYSDWKKIEKQV